MKLGRPTKLQERHSFTRSAIDLPGVATASLITPAINPWPSMPAAAQHLTKAVVRPVTRQRLLRISGPGLATTGNAFKEVVCFTVLFSYHWPQDAAKPRPFDFDIGHLRSHLSNLRRRGRV
ncbi:uncharacterized protein [Dermacentor albipictus]|uniref:uncharacterized protein n=1 Tax=Dermacentor albipictus TaxID=60249 RepID=UPI0031FD94C8